MKLHWTAEQWAKIWPEMFESTTVVRRAQQDIATLVAINERYRAALQACAADWVSDRGTVMGVARELHQEFKRRMEVAETALNDTTE